METIKREVGKDIEEQQKEDQKQHIHILAVDDSLLDRKLLEKLLKVSSYQVTCVDSGDKALEYLGLLNEPQEEGLKVNLIMTDYSMPGMSGYDLLKRVKGSSWKDVPVVVMSSENVPSRVSMCLKEGAEEFLVKPVKLSDLQKLQPCLLKSLQDTYKTKENSNNKDFGDQSIKSRDNRNSSKKKSISSEF